MIITKQYIMDNRTKNGAWTRSQIEALGIDYPPLKGWMSKVVGTRLDSDQVRKFESKEYAKKDRLSKVKLAINTLSDEDLSELKVWLRSH